MNKQRNKFIGCVLIVGLMILLCMREFGFVSDTLLILLVGLIVFDFMILPIIQNKQHERYNDKLHEKMQSNPKYQHLKLTFDEEMGTEKTTIYVDSRRNKWFVIEKGWFAPNYETLQIFDFSEILLVELINECEFKVHRRDKQGQDQLCTRLEIQIITRNLKMPMVTLLFINSEVSCQSKYYRRVLREAEYIKTMLTSMKFQGDDELYGYVQSQANDEQVYTNS